MNLKKIVSERPNILTIVGLLALLPIAIISHRCLAQFFSTTMILAAFLILTLRQKLFPVLCYNVSVILVIIFLLSPIDCTVRRWEKWHVGFVRVEHSSSQKPFRPHDNQIGKIENVDYVTYKWEGSFLGPYWAILITFPCKEDDNQTSPTFWPK